MRIFTKALCSLLLILPSWSFAEDSKPDPWAPVEFLVGQWRGTTTGQAGEGTVTRQYEFILHNRYIHERNTSTYPPQERNKDGEVHEHWSVMSYDKARRLIVFRQFHVEGFVNQYVFSRAASTSTKLVFESEHFENFDNKWRARETYEIASPNEFTETFELAPPDKPFVVYSKNHFKRVGS